MDNFQTYPVPLKPATFSAGQREPIPLDVPPTMLGGWNHIESIDFVCSVTPTLSSGALTPLEAQNIVTGLVVNDGIQNRCNVSFALLRFIEMLELGKLQAPDPDSAATTEPIYFSRRWRVGPALFAGSPTDHLLPAAAIKGGRIELQYGALADLDVAATAVTVTIQPIANCVPLYGELRIPPLSKWDFIDAAVRNIDVQGKALHHTLAMFNSGTYDAITAGDFANITLTGSAGVVGAATHIADLERKFYLDKMAGHITPVQGEPRAATDDNAKVVNPGTPTALVAATANVSPILWYNPGCRISKVRAYAESQFNIKWDGSQTTARILSGRLEAQGEAARAVMLARALAVLGLPGHKGLGIKTLSKKPYKGDVGDFMPWAAKT